MNSEEDGEHEKKKIWYFSSKAQLEELMEGLDKEYWEMDLYATLEEMKEEVQAHMAITEDLTNKARGNNKAYLTAVSGTVLMFSTFTKIETHLNLVVARRIHVLALLCVKVVSCSLRLRHPSTCASVNMVPPLRQQCPATVILDFEMLVVAFSSTFPQTKCICFPPCLPPRRQSG